MAPICGGKRDARDLTGESWSLKSIGAGAIDDAGSINRLTVSITRLPAGKTDVTGSEAHLAADKNGGTRSMERDLAHIAALI